ncbi:uncharacterized protein LOC101858747 [Aplysia californica]|uniref:Uncharacterized protein LOC101858747 n=1 Tax=Aplysia californica TaxID=6500 RepID=A0ABM0JA11_APLCA|nr:uncharacterized protein LOC101858747 [Aplysia californica]XP_005088887.1 uncharacterized protein LOC101858747 [Aplysia californica]
MAFVFHVEFGMNETPLTQALEQGDFAVAERIIVDCPNATYLDDGCYQRTPLYICLCGVDEYHQKVAVRNLYLAQLLIERGANVNHRVPVTNFGSEYMSPGKSCLELLIDFYIDLSRQSALDQAEPPWHLNEGQWNPLTQLVVGLNKQYLTRAKDVLDDLQDLIFSVLRHGGDPNVIDENRRTPAHRVAMHCMDVSLLKLICDNGASLTSVDSSGNTPLLALCNVSALDSDDSCDRMSPVSDSDILEACVRQEDLCVKTDFLYFLLKTEDSDINHQNSHGQTALLHLVLRGDSQGSRILLDAGADPSLQGFVWESRRKKRKLSPLFASLMSLPLQGSIVCSNLYTQVTRVPQFIAQLVDAGYFTTSEIAEELSSMIEHDFPEFSHLRPYAETLIHLMFGYKTASLKQLAARKVFQCCLIDSTACLHNILPVPSIRENFHAEDLLSDRHRYEEYISLVLNCTVLRRLVAMLHLPRSLLLHFEAQLLYLRMALKLHRARPQRPSRSSVVRLNVEENNSSGADSESGSDNSDSDGSSYESTSDGEVEGDSDLEYW